MTCRAVPRGRAGPRGPVSSGALALALVAAAWAPVHHAMAETPADTAATVCAGSGLRVQGSASATERADVCRGALAALTFLRSQGLTREPELTIEVTARLPEEVGVSAAGCFIQARNRAYVLSWAEFRRKRTWFGVPVSRDLYRALAAHETAHGVAGCHFTAPDPSIQAKEYVAYVAMFSTLPAALRNQALRAMPGTGFSDVGRINTTVYLFDPMRFGANAWRHYRSLPDGPAFLQQVMRGEVLAD